MHWENPARWCCSPPPGIGDRPKCDRGLVPCRLVGSASTVGWSGRAEVLRRRRSCRQHSRPHQPDSIDITALRHNLSLRLLPLLSPHLYVLLPVPTRCCPGQKTLESGPPASHLDVCRTGRDMEGNVLCTAASCLHSSLFQCWHPSVKLCILPNLFQPIFFP